MVGMYLIDTAGRKKLMAVGSGLMVLFALGISFSYANNYQLLMLIFVMCFTSCFAFSMGPIPWMMIPELFPTYLRGRATGICTVFLWGTSWAIGQFAPMLISSIGGMGTFLVFACTNPLCFLGVVTFVPETKDKTLEEIAELWQPKGEKRSNAQLEVVRATADPSRPSPTSRPPRPSWPRSPVPRSVPSPPRPQPKRWPTRRSSTDSQLLACSV